MGSRAGWEHVEDVLGEDLLCPWPGVGTFLGTLRFTPAKEAGADLCRPIGNHCMAEYISKTLFY